MTAAAEARWAAAVVALDAALEIGRERRRPRGAVEPRERRPPARGRPGAARFYSYALSRAREAGAVTAVVYCLQRLCFGHYAAGDHVSVRVCAEEAVALATSIGQPAMTALPLSWLALLAAQQGREDHDLLMAQVAELAGAHPLGITADPVHDLTRWAAGLRAAGTGDAAGAVHHLARIRLPFLARLTAVERIDAAARAGETATARAWTEELADVAEATRRPWARTAVAFGRAVTTAGSATEPFFLEALDASDEAGRPVDAARVRLAYGEWLRRGQRRVDARVHLRDALQTFRDVRAEAPAARAEQELRASGETARRRDPSTLLQLTPTELTIARLVSSGMSNKDVAAQCWVSPRTVAFHLRNVFAKAGVTSRGELARIDLG